MWWWCDFSEWTNMQVKRSFEFSSTRSGGGEAGTQSKKQHNTCCYRHCCLVSWKKWIRVSRFAWHHPPFTRIWNAQGKDGATSIRMPRPGCITPSYFVLHSCILPLFPCQVNGKSYWRWRGCFMISCCWEYLSCYRHDETVTLRCHGWMSGWSALD